MRFTGTLKTWHDDRGFGFIEPAQGGQEIFAHIKAFPSGTGRPAVGLQLTFLVELGANGKKRAVAIQFPAQAKKSATSRQELPATWTWPRILAIPAFMVLYSYVVWQWGFSISIATIYVGVSLLTFLAYVLDKGAAVAKQWRTPENTLHLLSLAGGWPGALIAQQILRHKTSKASFVVVFWMTIALNMAAFVALHAGLIHIPGIG